MKRNKHLIALACAVSLLALVPAANAQVRAPGEPPQPETAEAGLWQMLQEAEVQARRRSDRNNDPALNAYVSGLACKIAASHCGDIRVYVMDRPVFNAAAGANGYVEVWSGLLLRAETEDEVAFALGHEIAHFLEEHSYEALRRQKIVSNTLMVVSLGVGAAGMYYQVDISGVIDAAYLAGISSFFSYSQSQESQADELGLKIADDVGFNPAAGPAIWMNLQAENRESSFRRVRNADASASVFRTHPLTETRVQTLSEQAEVLGAQGTEREDRVRYRAIIRPYLAEWIEDEHRHRDFGRLLHLLDRLGKDGEDLGLLNYHKAEVYRRRREEGDDVLGLAAYRAAVAYPDVPVAAFRELGDLEIRAGNKMAARDALNKYRELAPDADDLWIIEDQLARLEGDAK